jgi:hypothetical protein
VFVCLLVYSPSMKSSIELIQIFVCLFIE